MTPASLSRTTRIGLTLAMILAAWALLLGIHVSAQTDPLPSWNDGAAKKAIIELVQATTTQGSPQFVPSKPSPSWRRSSRSTATASTW